MTTKNLKMEDIKVIFEKIQRQHKASILQKNQEMFYKQEQSILALISGNNSLTNQHLNNYSKDVNNLKESLEFSQNEYDDKFKNTGDKIKKLEEKINLMKEELHVIHRTKPSRAIDTDAKLIDFSSFLFFSSFFSY